MKRVILFSIIVLAGFQNCKTAAKTTIAEKPIFTLFRTTCFGTCPSYSIEVYNNRKVVFEGLHFVEPIGKYTFSISSIELKELKQKFEELAIAKFDSLYPQDGLIPQDIPSVIITSNIDGKEKKTEVKGSRAPAAIREWIETLETLKTSVLSKNSISPQK